jgi:hypothetical protein
MASITIEEVKIAISNQTEAREKSLAQANYYAGSISAWEEVLARLESVEEISNNEEAESVENTLESVQPKPRKTKNTKV